jgi:prepilin-type N-terminal cleavage/methylation domain-containing protein
MLARAKKAFTLIELIAVVVVLGILAALAVPTFSAVKQSAAEEIATRSAEGIINEAKALAAFDGAPLSDSYVDAAGVDALGYTDTTNSIRISRSGVAVYAVISVNVAGVPTITLSNTQP